MENHTPGPWIITDFEKITDVNGKMITLLLSNSGSLNTKLANAKLLAAAPELLEACIAAFSLSEEIASFESWEMVQGQLLSAIQKATK